MLVEDMIDLKPTSLVTLTPEMKLQQVCGVIRKNSWITLFPVLRADGVVSYFIHSKIIENLTEWPAPEACVDVNLQQEVARGQENAMQLLNRFAHSDMPYIYVLDESSFLLGAVRCEGVASGAIQRSLDFIPVPEIFDALHDAIIIIDGTGTIGYLNHSYSRLLGGSGS